MCACQNLNFHSFGTDCSDKHTFVKTSAVIQLHDTVSLFRQTCICQNLNCYALVKTSPVTQLQDRECGQTYACENLICRSASGQIACQNLSCHATLVQTV